MALPSSLTTVILQDTYLKPDGSPEVGAAVQIYSNEFIRSASDGISIGPLNYDTELDITGSISYPVPATNDPQWVPIDFTYLVKISLSTGVRTFRLSVPFDTPSGILKLSGVAPTITNPVPQSYVLVSQANVDSGYAKIDPTTHKISPSVIPAGGGSADGAFRGTYSGAATYITGDTVIYSGATYGALQGSANKTPDTNPTFWQTYPDAGAGAQPLDPDLTAIAGLTATTDNVIQSVGGTWASRTMTQLKSVMAIAIADVVNLASVLTAKADIASPTFTGTATAPRILTPTVALADAATILVDAALGNDMAVTLGGNRTLGNPSNPPTTAQKILFAIRQDATGTRTLTLGTSYRLGTDVTAVTLTTTAGKTDYLGVRYNVADAKWDVIAFVRGY